MCSTTCCVSTLTGTDTSQPLPLTFTNQQVLDVVGFLLYIVDAADAADDQSTQCVRPRGGVLRHSSTAFLYPARKVAVWDHDQSRVEVRGVTDHRPTARSDLPW